MRGDSLGWWIVKAVLSAAYWVTATAVAVGLFFGDRVVPLRPEEQVTAIWARRGFAAGAILLYALLSHGWNRWMARTDRRR